MHARGVASSMFVSRWLRITPVQERLHCQVHRPEAEFVTLVLKAHHFGQRLQSSSLCEAAKNPLTLHVLCCPSCLTAESRCGLSLRDNRQPHKTMMKLFPFIGNPYFRHTGRAFFSLFFPESQVPLTPQMDKAPPSNSTWLARNVEQSMTHAS